MKAFLSHAGIAALALGLLAVPATAQDAPLNPPGNSAPMAILPVDRIPASQDIAYPGTMRLDVDATDIVRRIFRVTQTVPVAKAGPTAFVVPEWLPGKHGPRGVSERVAELVFRADGKIIPWTRDPVQTSAYWVDVPAGARDVTISFTTLTPLDTSQGRIVVTPELMNIQWEMVSMYPAGYYTRRIPVIATVKYPKGWQAATALRGTTGEDGRVTYGRVSYETLQDSPVFAGAYVRRDDLGHGVTLNNFAHSADKLKAPDSVIAKYRSMVDQAVKLFGSRHYDHYDILSALSNDLGGIGLEHHRSTEITADPDALVDYDNLPDERGVYPHEFVHSWDGKFRRPADLYTPDFHVPMRDSLLWVYEGQTMLWGVVLEARSGMSSKQHTLDYFANVAANYDTLPARSWRSLLDTTNDPIITQRKPQPWGTAAFRNEDYYSEGMLIWIEADAIIRNGTGGKRGMDDFARAFFGMRDGDWGELLYNRADVAATLNQVYPYDWTTFLADRVDKVQPHAPLAGLIMSGYELQFRDTPNDSDKKALAKAGGVSFTYSLGLSAGKDGKVSGVKWEGPAFDSGLMIGDEIVAVGKKLYSSGALKDAVVGATADRNPIRLTIKRNGELRTVDIPYHGGLRYPHLVKTGKGEGPLDLLLRPR